MEAGVSPARQARTHYRHDLRTLTYVTIDQANGGIVRNLTHEGMGVQAVAALRPRQQLRVRFELRYPRLRIESQGEVIWATPSGQCGIRFLDLSPRMSGQINEWIFGNLLEGSSLHAERPGSMFARPARGPAKLDESPSNGRYLVLGAEEDDGLMVSAVPLKVIELPAKPEPPESLFEPDGNEVMTQPDPVPLDWLSQPLSGRGLAWTINTLVVLAGLLLFVLVFLGITGEAPPWPLAMTGGAALLVAGMYWGFFQLLGVSSLGTRLARLAAWDEEQDEEARGARFR